MLPAGMTRIAYAIISALDENQRMAEEAAKVSDLARKSPLANLSSIGEGVGGLYKVLAIVAAAAVGFFLLKLFWNIFFGWIPATLKVMKYKKEHEENLSPLEKKRKAAALASSGHPREAATLYLEAGDTTSAAELYEKAGERCHAATILEKAGLYTAAARVHERNSQFRQAARCHTLDGHYREAAEALLKAGDAAEAAKNFEQIGETQRAADLYSKLGLLQKAAEMYAACGQKDKQARALDELVKKSRTTDLINRADVEKALEDCNRFASAASLYMKRGDFVKAIVALVRAGELEKACGIYARIDERPSEDIIKAIDFSDRDIALGFAQFFLRARDQKAAARIFDNIGRYREAAELAERYGDFY
ncbi:MAG: hypothetical protein WC889_09990, partial [Myxococcota bacterium]